MDRLLSTALLTALIFTVISLQIQHAQGQTLAITSLPAALFESNGGVHNIVQGSVIQLYCSVESSTATFSWTKDGYLVVINVPHLRQRLCNDSNTTTSVLTIEGFQSRDNGTYQCLARDGVDSGNGTVVTLTALSSTADGSLILDFQPINNEALFESVYIADYRTGVTQGSTVDGSLLTCEVKGLGAAPTVLWTLNGKLIANSTLSAFSSSLEIVNFNLSDAGIYQCIFTDTDVDSEIVTSTPFRVDTDIYTEYNHGFFVSTLSLERISPEVVYLHPPEKLVIEVKAKGRFREVRWHFNGALISYSQSSFSNYNEIYFIEESSEANFGLYEISLRLTSLFQILRPSELDVIVTSSVDANTTVMNGSVVTVFEGMSVIISCISTGAPAPSIIWMQKGQIVPFITADITTKEFAGVIRNERGELAPYILLGNIISSLQIANAQYPDHDGVYTCVGTNDDKMVNTSSADITVQVLVTPDVEIIVPHGTRVSTGTTITMHCNVSRTNPGITAYRWIHGDTNILLGNTNMLTLTLTVTEDFGIYQCEVTNAANLTGIGNVTIEQGFPPIVTTLQPPPVVVYTTVELICVATGVDPPRNITWSFRDMEVYYSNETAGANVTLNITTSDYGVYTCMASNEYGSGIGTIEIQQAAAPSLIPEAISIEVEIGTQLTLAVNITSFNVGVTSVTWRQNGDIIIDQVGGFAITNMNLNTSPGYSILELDSVISPTKHGGIYQVTVTNPAGSATSSFNVSVSAQPILIAPIMDLNLTIPEAYNITLTCIVKASPALNCNWYHDGTMLRGTEARTIITQNVSTDLNGFYLTQSVLTISSSIKSDSGSYTCRATNMILGSVRHAMRTFDVNVYFSITIYENPMDITILSPERAILHCLASGEPLPEIVWIKEFANGSVINIDDLTNITEITNAPNKTSILTIEPTNAQDTAKYSCRVQNRLHSLTSGKAKVTILIRTESFIQLRLSPIDSCVRWTEGNRDEKQATITTSLLNVINDRCNCDFNSENIAESLFSCRSSQTQVVFKAQIYYIYNTSQPEQFSVENITRIINVWVSNGPSLTISGVVLNVDPSCPVQAESWTAEDCVQSLPSNEFSNDSSAIIWGPIIGILIVIIAVLVTIILLFSYFQRRKSKSTSLSRPSSHELDLKPTVTLSSPAHQLAPEYEVIPAFQETGNPVAEPNVAYGMIGPKPGQES